MFLDLLNVATVYMYMLKFQLIQVGECETPILRSFVQYSRYPIPTLEEVVNEHFLFV